MQKHLKDCAVTSGCGNTGGTQLFDIFAFVKPWSPGYFRGLIFCASAEADSAP